MKIQSLGKSILYSLMMLIVLEVIGSTLFPSFGLDHFGASFHILIIIYFGLKLATPFLPILILMVELVHGAFSVEGWALGTFTGIVVCFFIGQLRDLLQLQSHFLTIIIVQVLLLVWFTISALLLYVKLRDWSYFSDRFLDFLPESIFLSLLSPLLFNWLDQIWPSPDSSQSEVGV